MIVSGFTQNRHVEDAGTLYGPLDHKHCVTCFRRGCSIRPDDVNSCKIIDCPRGCPARFHACKEWEHLSLCMEERVKCINEGNGCPALMARSRLGQHLRTCPASIVVCTAEWNRSPMCPPKAGEKPYLPKAKHFIDCGQLDVALAMRDHRALIDMLHAPRRTRRILRNPLTQRYPAAPFGRCSSQESDVPGSEDNLAVSSDEEEDPARTLTQPWLGARSGFHSPLYQASRQTANSLTTALDLVSNHMSQTGVNQNMSLPQQEHGEAGPSTSVDLQRENSASDVLNADGPGFTEVSLQAENGAETVQNVTASADLLSSTVSSTPPVHEAAASTSQPFQNEAGPSTLPGAGVSDTPGKEQSRTTKKLSQHLKDEAGPSTANRMNLSSPQAADSAAQNAGKSEWQSQSDIETSTANSIKSKAPDGSSSHAAENSRKNMESMLSLDGHPLHKLLGVNLGVECITKYQPKQSYMYTFLCGQELRRDQFPYHFHNVHNEIQSGLSGWMEQRCPLAYLGCPFSFRRFCPDAPGMSVCHSWLHESFGLRSRWPDELPSHQTPECLIPSSVEVVDWCSNVDQLNKQCSVDQEPSPPEPKCANSCQNVDHGEQSVEIRVSSSYSDHDCGIGRVGQNVDSVPRQDHNTVCPEQAQCSVDSITNVLPSASGLSEDTVGASETDSFAMLLDSLVLDESVDSPGKLSSGKTCRTDEESSCDRRRISDSTSRHPGDVRQTRHSEKCPRNSLTSTDTKSVDGQAVDGQASMSIRPSESEQSVLKTSASDEPHNVSISKLDSVPSEEASVHKSVAHSDVQPVLFTGASAHSLIRLDYTDRSAGDTTSESSVASSENLELTDLPIEVLQHIARFLDSFSLYNMSLVSRLLRDVCCSLLDEKGIVSLIWDCKRSGTHVQWQVVGKRWSFSLSFQNVRHWQFTGHNPISPHLLTCPYNRDRLVRTERFSIIPQNETPSDQQIKHYLEEKERQPSRPPRYLPHYITWLPQ